jgi:arylesterase / paraoxonase
MKPTKVLKSLLPLAALVTIAYWAWGLLHDAGAFRAPVVDRFDGECRAVAGVLGPEDLEWARRSHTLFISSDPRAVEGIAGAAAGGLYSWDTSDVEARPVALAVSERPFHPHGLSSFEDEDGSVVLFVVNHPTDSVSTSVERFVWRSGRLEHQATLRDPALFNGNDVVAIDARRFYVTLDHGYRETYKRKLELYSRRGHGKVAFYDGARFQVVADGIAYANGLALSADGRQLFVASMTQNQLLVYARDPRTNALRRQAAIELPGGPDNVQVGLDGALWVGAHPDLFALKAYSQDRARPSPSRVLRVLPPFDGSASVTEVFADRGARLGSASTAVDLGDRLVLGAVFDDHLLDCKPNAQSLLSETSNQDAHAR